MIVTSAGAGVLTAVHLEIAVPLKVALAVLANLYLLISRALKLLIPGGGDDEAR